jgi:chromosome segregation ATPase
MADLRDTILAGGEEGARAFDELLRRVDALNAKVSESESKLGGASAQLADAHARIAGLEQCVRDANSREAEFASRTETLARQLREAQAGGDFKHRALKAEAELRSLRYVHGL